MDNGLGTPTRISVLTGEELISVDGISPFRRRRHPKMKGGVEVFEDRRPVAISRPVTLIHDDKVEVVGGIALEQAVARWGRRLKRLVDREMHVPLEWQIGTSLHYSPGLTEPCKLVVCRVAQVDSVAVPHPHLHAAFE